MLFYIYYALVTIPFLVPVLCVPKESQSQNQTNVPPPQPYRECVASYEHADWNPPVQYPNNDCEEALQLLENDGTEYQRYGEGKFHWNGGHQWGQFGFRVLPLPKQYEYGKCVVTVIMMRSYRSQAAAIQFPGLTAQSIQHFGTTDSTTFHNIAFEAGYIRSTCQNGRGYSIVGAEWSLGVAIWEQGCKWDDWVKRLIRIQESGGSVSGTTVNGSSSVENAVALESLVEAAKS